MDTGILGGARSPPQFRKGLWQMRRESPSDIAIAGAVSPLIARITIRSRLPFAASRSLRSSRSNSASDTCPATFIATSRDSEIAKAATRLGVPQTAHTASSTAASSSSSEAFDQKRESGSSSIDPRDVAGD